MSLYVASKISVFLQLYDFKIKPGALGNFA